MKISFIIPAYNAESYIEKCLVSLLPFIEMGHEVIVVNDGSTDTTLEKAMKAVRDKNNVTFISQQNQGQASARNNGLTKATGDYIWFVDADDFVDVESARMVVKEAESLLYDAIVFGLNLEEEKKVVPAPVLEYKVHQNGVDYFNESIMKGTFRTFPWNKIFKRSLIQQHNIAFPVDLVPFEDMQFNMAFFLRAGLVQELPVNPYHYILTNPNSSTNKNRIQQRDLRALTAVEKTTEMIDTGNYQIESSGLPFQVLIYTFISSCLLKKYIPLSFTFPEAKDFVKRTMSNSLFKKAVYKCAMAPSIGLARWGMAFCILLSPRYSRYLIKWLM